MNNLIINPQFTEFQQTRRKNYIGLISEEIIVLKAKRERRNHLATTMDPSDPKELLTHHHGGSKVDEDCLPNGFPSGRVPEKAST